MLCPFARHELLPENKVQSKITPDQLIFHSAVDAKGETDLYGFFNGKGVNVESNFFVQMDGDIIQYMDTERRADANYYANRRAISIETEDDGKPDITPWTPEQVKSLIRLGVWIVKVHPLIKAEQCNHWDSPGIGWHTMWGAPSNWTPTKGKTCPGRVRIAQMPHIIREIARPRPQPPSFRELLDMKLTDKITIPADYKSNPTVDEPVEISVEDAIRRIYEWSYISAYGTKST